MSTDDIIYLLLLFGSIGISYWYRTLYKSDVSQRKWIGTAIGVAVVLFVSGIHILHILISGAICSAIILLLPKRIIHLASFGFMFTYLMFFRMTNYFGIPSPPGQTNLIQMMLTLKIVGLAFEINFAWQKSKKVADDKTIQMSTYDMQVLNVGPIDIMHYCLNFIGILTGPYFRYRTFSDYFTYQFAQNADTMAATWKKLKWVPLYAAQFLFASYMWPLSYATNVEFYEDRSFWYRLWYIWPTFYIFRMRIYIGLTLSECVCTMAGLGAYPTTGKATAGGGPNQDYEHNTKNLDTLEYDFETVHNVNVYGVETCWTFREAMKHWNMCIQYWLAIYIYKPFPNKQLRTLVTLLVSAYWHGVHSGYYLCIVGAPFYMPIESLYHNLIRANATGVKRQIIDVLFWISKFFAFSYLGTAFLLMNIDKIWFFYNSVYHVGYIYFAAIYVVGVVLMKMRKGSKSKQDAVDAKQSTNKKVE